MSSILDRLGQMEYYCHYRGNSIWIKADSRLDARDQAAMIFEAMRPWDVSILGARLVEEK